MRKIENNKIKQVNPYKKIISIGIGCFIVLCTLGFIGSKNIEKKEREEALRIKTEQVAIEEAERIAKEKEETESKKSVFNWIEYNKDKVCTSFDEENKNMSITLNFSRTLSMKNRIDVANYDIYKLTKELEELFKDDIESYKFDFVAEVVDQYGSKKEDVVYTIILNRNELNNVNWEGIQPSMLINLASHNYKNPVIQ